MQQIPILDAQCCVCLASPRFLFCLACLLERPPNYEILQAGNSVLANVTQFMPYFYVPVPRGFDNADLDAFMDALNVSRRAFQTNTP